MATRCSTRIGAVATLWLLAAALALSSGALDYMHTVGRSVRSSPFAGAMRQQRGVQVRVRAEEDEMSILGPLNKDEESKFFEAPKEKKSSADVQGGGVFAVLMSSLALGVCVTMTAPAAVNAMTTETAPIKPVPLSAENKLGAVSGQNLYFGKPAAQKAPLEKLGTVAGYNLYFGSPGKQ